MAVLLDDLKLQATIANSSYVLLFRAAGEATPPITPKRECRSASGSLWHSDGMARIRLSTTVDDDLLRTARQLHSGTSDAAMIDDALRALVACHRSAEIDASYAAYDNHPLDEPDEWGNLAAFREAAARS